MQRMPAPPPPPSTRAARGPLLTVAYRVPRPFKLLPQPLAGLVAVVFRPRRDHDGAAGEHEHDGGVKGRDAAKVHLLNQEVAEEARQDGHEPVAEKDGP